MNHFIRFFILLLTLSPVILTAQDSAPTLKGKVNLEDINIQGQSNSDQGLFNNRDRMNLDSRIKMKSDFRQEILENLPENYEPLQLAP
ncbi:MAG TPA: hypothetical protein PLJ21_04045 [Pseudobdellovibrionaceae bacterium]|nr:hypothetical protein [Pseudobdellovibrionaceae bacterium]